MGAGGDGPCLARGIFPDMARNTKNQHSASDTCCPKDVPGSQGPCPKSKYSQLFEHFPSTGTRHAPSPELQRNPTEGVSSHGHPSSPGKYGDQREPSRTHHHRIQPSTAALEGAEHHSQDGTGYA